jgi:hypothetical protein
LSNTPYSWLDRAALADDAYRRAQLLESGSADSSPSHRLRRSDLELRGSLYWPKQHYSRLAAKDPGPEIVFLTVANDKFYRGLEALILSLLDVYPQLTSTIVVVHDGTLGPFLRDRLCSIYPRISFEQPRPSWADSLPADSANRKRIGALGYLNSFALGLRGYRRAIILDSDILVLDSIDPLWADGDAVYVGADCGDRPWSAVSAFTKRPVLNSGVISLPGSALCAAEHSRLDALIVSAGESVCPLLDRFADQKVWNLWLLGREVQILPLNYNCNIKYLVQYLGGCYEGLSVVHFAGPKPWLDWPWVAPDDDARRGKAVVDHLLWNRVYRRLLYRWRLRLWTDAQSRSVSVPAGPAHLGVALEEFSSAPARDLDASRHLILAHYQVFAGGWPNHPCWPEGWLERMAAIAPLWLWAPFEWEPALRHLPLPPGVHWRWVLIEAPFSPDLANCEDVLAEETPWESSFQPFDHSPVLGLERAVRLQLIREGAIPLPGTRHHSL